MFEARISALPEPSTLKDAKTRLQEYLQGTGRPLPVYSVKRTSGEPHAQTFLVGCSVPQMQVETEGEGPSRRRAEQVAAQAALTALGVPG
jgi:ribonuclease-3